MIENKKIKIIFCFILLILSTVLIILGFVIPIFHNPIEGFILFIIFLSVFLRSLCTILSSSKNEKQFFQK